MLSGMHSNSKLMMTVLFNSLRGAERHSEIGDLLNPMSAGIPKG